MPQTHEKVPDTDEEETENYREGLLTALTSDQAKLRLEVNAASTTQACKTVDTTFTGLGVR